MLIKVKSELAKAIYGNVHFVLKTILLLSFLFLPVSSFADMRSDSYIISENVTYEFDGPTITSISAGSVTSSGATITWTTDVAADSYVKYATNVALTSSKEQGADAKTATSHSVVLVGLSASTKYYYEVRSTGQNNGSTETSSGGSFTTSAASSESTTTTTTSPGGGGILIIDKNDKVAPTVLNVAIEEIGAESAVINWETDEEATSFIEYGKDANYGSTFGSWDSAKTHRVRLTNLTAEQDYYFVALSSDGSGNLGESQAQVFRTLSYTAELDETIALGEEAISAGTVSEESLLEKLNIIKKMAQLLPGPSILGEPRVEVWADRATISWQSDKKATSQIALAPTGGYNPNSPEPYQQIVGGEQEGATEHQVELYNLQPNTIYNYQVRMKPSVGAEMKSDNFIFRTLEENLEISNYYLDIIDQQKVRFRWATNSEADSAIRFIPYRGNVLAVDEARTIKDNATSVIHDITVEEFLPGGFYDVEILSVDSQGNIAIEVIKYFSTGEDNEAPVIGQVRTNSTIFIGEESRAQTVISWMTNEPATSRVYYLEGVHRAEEEWPAKTELEDSFNKRHIKVINDFKQGQVYSFRLENSDSGGNTSLSQVFTFITPQRRESIFNIIINILEDLFGWLFKGKGGILSEA
ncbi:MAG: hypothetical protein COV91_04015 [Candidatus Taylorbacteria bacterium CG11_big_fil_rev_8_21_14_0_20_46_11]|uniref:Fibronectin type-III domain-containing protein n=1 Tax=Candidatus Taylorbacteria bacterium CG11_big_fil_rev_8_21_14_0_20_46_11 TaxID=1975025 RepID=A0A2H0KB24_9BACT|nr:MAG: hypothetical protein COV91_04015 [Candidatus Taylorbacteria bacterium CG11_big_fil_rev_8_21_14_0_20_46_11]